MSEYWGVVEAGIYGGRSTGVVSDLLVACRQAAALLCYVGIVSSFFTFF